MPLPRLLHNDITTDGVDRSKSISKAILVLQSLILMTKTLHSVTSVNVHHNTSPHDVGNLCTS